MKGRNDVTALQRFSPQKLAFQFRLLDEDAGNLPAGAAELIFAKTFVKSLEPLPAAITPAWLLSAARQRSLTSACGLRRSWKCIGQTPAQEELHVLRRLRLNIRKAIGNVLPRNAEYILAKGVALSLHQMSRVARDEFIDGCENVLVIRLKCPQSTLCGLTHDSDTPPTATIAATN
jgi:hypothetical protein